MMQVKLPMTHMIVVHVTKLQQKGSIQFENICIFEDMLKKNRFEGKGILIEKSVLDVLVTFSSRFLKNVSTLFNPTSIYRIEVSSSCKWQIHNVSS